MKKLIWRQYVDGFDSLWTSRDFVIHLCDEMTTYYHIEAEAQMLFHKFKPKINEV